MTEQEQELQLLLALQQGEGENGDKIQWIACPYNSNARILVVGNGRFESHRLCACQALSAKLDGNGPPGCLYLFKVFRPCPFVASGRVLNAR